MQQFLLQLPCRSPTSALFPTLLACKDLEFMGHCRSFPGRSSPLVATPQVVKFMRSQAARSEILQTVGASKISNLWSQMSCCSYGITYVTYAKLRILTIIEANVTPSQVWGLEPEASQHVYTHICIHTSVCMLKYV